MKQSILAQRTAQEIHRIGELLGIDLSSAALPKAPDQAHRRYFELQRIRQGLEEMDAGVPPESVDVEADLLDRISRIEGIGPATIDRIMAGLRAQSD